ncbi:hypothetical protein EIP91_009746 [Steccherinum ochraceum]|uniref:Xylanolytic transcriptional activator regulatory domain-containing protein n=1 Tax=Steccherinum ochraceum TaxID=92696 RepID=A0A4R0R6Q4_9APHY|nr:hypothetical protein EIP91_009746 [Steccherinum ochraceum]
MRDILRKQIREKDAMIDQLLGRLNPSPSLATPLAIVPSKLCLTPEQRQRHQAVLAWLDKHRGGSKNATDPRAKIDVSALEDEPCSDESGEEDDDEDDEEGDEFAAAFLLQLDFTPAASAPAGILASTALLCSRRCSPTPASPEGEPSEEDSRDLKVEGGIGCRTYFAPGPSTNLELRRLIVERQAAPEILLSGLVTHDDVGKLFDIFFKTINRFVPILDENIHTPAGVLGRCPFLFTVVCSLASRYYSEKPDIHPLAMHLAKAAAGNAFIGGWKTVEMCQAYLLLGSYSPPARRLEEDRSWFYSGMSFRPVLSFKKLAIELNLNRVPDMKPTDERNQRELLNRIRTWITCYVMDRCVGVNLGKPFMIPEDGLIRNAEEHLLRWKYHQPADIYLVSLTELLRIITRFSERVNPVFEHQVNMRQHSDLMTLHSVTDVELSAWRRTTEERYDGVLDDIGQALQLGLMRSVFYYCRLITFSVGLQQVITQNGLQQDAVFFIGCLNAACSVLEIMLNDLIPSGLIHCSPEHVFTLSAFATAVLIKSLRPQFAFKLTHGQEDHIIALVQRLLSGLDAEKQGLDDQHASRRYARFLGQLLQPHMKAVEARRRTEDAVSSLADPTLSADAQARSQPFHAQPSYHGEFLYPSMHGTGTATSGLPPHHPHAHDHMFNTYDTHLHASHSIWDDTLSSSDRAAVPMPPILAYPDPVFLASMFSYTAEQADQTNLF